MSKKTVVVVVDDGVQRVYSPGMLPWEVIDYNDLEEQGLNSEERVRRAMEVLDSYGYGEPNPDETEQKKQAAAVRLNAMRDAIAVAAMQAIVGNNDYGMAEASKLGFYTALAREAYVIADAMIHRGIQVAGEQE